MIKHKLIRWFCYLLPKKGRRTIFLTTLFMKLNNIKPGDFKAMQEFNNTLNIVDDVQALKVPCHIYKVIWNEIPLPENFNCFEHVDTQTVRLLSAEILSHKRGVKDYGDRESMLSDISKLISFTLEKNEGHLPCHV